MASPLLPHLLALTRASHSLPDRGEISFARSMDRTLGAKLDGLTERLEKVVERVGGPKIRGTGEWEEETEWKKVWEGVEEKYLENADNLIDRHRMGETQPTASTSAVPLTPSLIPTPSQGKLPKHLYNPPNTPKPQLLFPSYLQFDNSPSEFVPLYPPPSSVDIPTPTSHPILFEQPHVDLDRTWEGSFDTVAMAYVDTVESFEAMVEEIRESKEKELAVDLEHHDYHSYAGILCVMQLSTRQKDWVVDLLKPELRPLIHKLKEFFEDPAWIKVLHGAFMDVTWLQRDFGIYIVSLFDTFEASKTLGYPKNSLAVLLKTFCNFDADKRYQLADWRIRPLPSEMLHYARSDTHFLLYIYDRLRYSLFHTDSSYVPPEGVEPTQPALMSYILTRSRETSYRRFKKDEQGAGPHCWGMILKKTGMTGADGEWANDGSGVAYEVGQDLADWRDRMARSEDESHRYILIPQKIITLATVRPSTVSDVLQICHPASLILAKHALGVVKIIKHAADRAEAKLRSKAASSATQEAVQEDVVMGSVGATDGADSSNIAATAVEIDLPKVRPIPGIWGKKTLASPHLSNVQAPSSLLFAPNPIRYLHQPHSSLFPSQLSPPADGQKIESVRSVHLRIQTEMRNESPVAPAIADTLQQRSSSNAVCMEERIEVETIVPDHVFVPRDQRTTIEGVAVANRPTTGQKEDSEEDDILIVSALPNDKKKKRKRLTDEESGASTPITESAKGGKKKKKARASNVPMESVDYSTINSLLDIMPDEQVAHARRDKKTRDKLDFPDDLKMKARRKMDFPDDLQMGRPLKVDVKPKSGNMSATFPT
ncbi:hypothetical protein BT69DRAFT_1335260 [Atractiella rhizophila]|nr:hypothetical protein BT69DRAFT_1335260 [Atractiella rhizophila]